MYVLTIFQPAVCRQFAGMHELNTTGWKNHFFAVKDFVLILFDSELKSQF